MSTMYESSMNQSKLLPGYIVTWLNLTQEFDAQKYEKTLLCPWMTRKGLNQSSCGTQIDKKFVALLMTVIERMFLGFQTQSIKKLLTSMEKETLTPSQQDDITQVLSFLSKMKQLFEEIDLEAFTFEKFQELHQELLSLIDEEEGKLLKQFCTFAGIYFSMLLRETNMQTSSEEYLSKFEKEKGAWVCSVTNFNTKILVLKPNKIQILCDKSLSGNKSKPDKTLLLIENELTNQVHIGYDCNIQRLHRFALQAKSFMDLKKDVKNLQEEKNKSKEDKESEIKIKQKLQGVCEVIHLALTNFTNSLHSLYELAVNQTFSPRLSAFLGMIDTQQYAIGNIQNLLLSISNDFQTDNSLSQLPSCVYRQSSQQSISPSYSEFPLHKSYSQDNRFSISTQQPYYQIPQEAPNQQMAQSMMPIFHQQSTSQTDAMRIASSFNQPFYNSLQNYQQIAAPQAPNKLMFQSMLPTYTQQQPSQTDATRTATSFTQPSYQGSLQNINQIFPSVQRGLSQQLLPKTNLPIIPSQTSNPFKSLVNLSELHTIQKNSLYKSGKNPDDDTSQWTISKQIDEARRNITKKECPICCEQCPSNEFWHLKCGHIFCYGCFKQQIAAKLSEGKRAFNDFTCLLCMLQIDPTDLYSFLTDSEKLQIDEYYSNKTLNFVCPNQRCQIKSFLKEKDLILSEYFTTTCCSIKVCSKCKQIYHPDRKCPTQILFIIQSIKTYRDSQTTENARLFRFCPVCFQFAFKDSGCNHVSCASCKCEFCFWCSAPRKPIIGHSNHFHRKGCPDFAEYLDKNKKPVESQYEPKTCEQCRQTKQPCKRPCSWEIFNNLVKQQVGQEIFDEFFDNFIL